MIVYTSLFMKSNGTGKMRHKTLHSSLQKYHWTPFQDFIEDSAWIELQLHFAYFRRELSGDLGDGAIGLIMLDIEMKII